MQTMLASLVIAMSVKDAAYNAGMASARAEAKKTEAELDRASEGMAGSVQSAAREINAAAVRMGESLANAAATVRRAGIAMTVALTAPIAAIGKGTKDSAATFEQAFGQVRAAMLKASPKELDDLREAAMKIGPAFGKNAAEAASAIEMLAKNGLSAAQIMGGALSSAMTLAAIGGADLEASANLTTDIMQQFGKTAKDLPVVVDKVTGAMDASKLSFDDYRLAIGQTGGVAGGLGYAFEEVNVALAATSSLFASGSDAGTSFKTFLTSLVPKTKEAEETMKALGLSFFDAEGKAKPLADIADMLRVKLGNLDDKSKTDVLTTIFGTDAMRTAIGLMQEGSAGLNEIASSIDSVQAKDKLSIVSASDVAATNNMSSAINLLAIRMGEVLLPISTAVKNAIATMISVVASAPPWFFTLSTAVALAVASIGPMILAVTTLASVALPLLLLRLGPVALAFSALINPFGVIIRLLGQLALMAGASSILGLIGTRMIALAGPVGLVIGLLSIFVPLLLRTVTASKQYADAQNAANERSATATDLTNQLASATGKLRQELLAKIRVEQASAAQAVISAKANLQAARASLVRAKAEAAQSTAISNVVGMERGGGQVARSLASERVTQATADMTAALGAIATEIKTLDGINNTIRTAAAPVGPTSFSLPGEANRTKKVRERKGRDTSRDEDQYLDELGRLRVAELEARATLTDSYIAQHRAALVAIEEERAAYVRQLAQDEALDATKRATLLAAKDAELEQRGQIVDQQQLRDRLREAHEIATEANAIEQDALRARADMADTAGERRAAELRLLALQRRQEEAAVELALATESTGTAAWENARQRRDALGAEFAAREAGVRRDTEGPAERYLRQIDLSAAQLRETTEDMGVSTLARFNDTLADTASGFLKLGGIAGQVFNQLIADMMRLQLQKAILPLARSLLGGGNSLAGLLGQGNGITSANAVALPYGGGKASGGRVSPGHWYMVGENGPEPFFPDSAGRIEPNSSLRKSAGRRPVSFDLRGAVMTADLLAQMNSIALETGGELLVANSRSARRAGRMTKS